MSVDSPSPDAVDGAWQGFHSPCGGETPVPSQSKYDSLVSCWVSCWRKQDPPHKEQEVIPLGREERFTVMGGAWCWGEQDHWGRRGSTSNYDSASHLQGRIQV